MVDVTDLTFRYRGGERDTLAGLTFHIGDGEIFGFLGPSGAGKSTTQRILTGLLGGYHGTVLVDGVVPTGAGAAFYERIGVGFEYPNLYTKLTGRENLRFFASLFSGDTEDIDTLFERVGLAEDADRVVAAYSKGMRMRLSLCRALINRPRLLFLDEPTSGLDPGYARGVREVIRAAQREGTTIFLTTHNMTLADELCDRVAFLVDGRLALTDRPAALRRSFGRRAVAVEHGADGDVRTSEFDLEGLGDNREFLALLRTATLRTIHTQETTLEDVFIRTTGRTLA